ncbi:DUF6790 family protein [Butyricimonas sp. BSD2780061689_150309_C8]|uniref:DUF6790 family protein n=1 Tax=Butyricimonas sp. BSD2780061689_150309_C8 TaxID=2787088 RepID=UPI0039774D50
MPTGSQKAITKVVAFLLVTIIPFSTFLISGGSLHVKEIYKKRNLNPGNTWIILPDFLIPLTLISLFYSK